MQHQISDKQYGVMLIGCGNIGRQHLEDIYYRDNINICAVVDTDLERAELFAKKFNAKAYGADYRFFLNDKSIDIVIIATNVDTHVNMLHDCVKRDKHVLCEKPVAATLQDGQSFFDIAFSSSQKVLVGHILRYNKSYQVIKSLIYEGAIGELRLMRMVQNHHSMDWNRYKRLLKDATPIVDCGVHYFDVMQWFTGEKIVSVNGMSTWLDDDIDVNTHHENYGIVNLKLENGCRGYYEAGWSRNLQAKNTKEFIGTKGRISLRLQQERLENREEGDLIQLYTSCDNKYTTINQPSVYKNMYAQICDLVAMIENKKSDIPSLKIAHSAFIVSIAADKAIKSGNLVNPANLIGNYQAKKA